MTTTTTVEFRDQTPRRQRPVRHLVALLVLLAVSRAGAQEPAPADPARGLPLVGIARTDAPPEIDGLLTDPAWASAAVIDDFTQVLPVEGDEPSERTEVRLLFDSKYLYVAFRCFDREPDAIVATTMQRDASLGADDRISFVLGPFFDRRNGFFFEMNPAGAKGDALLEDNDRFIRDWDGIWYGRATIDEEGWTAEIAIPFQTISFNPNTEKWGFNASRVVRRRNESIRWASPSPDKSFNSLADAGVIEGFTELSQGVGLDVKPFGLWRYDRDDDDHELDAGLDLFYNITPRTTLSLTFNTDFAETEVDERRVNLTRFPLFFPEKRDFFLKDAGIFSFGGINRNPLPFFSRRIGIGPDGQPLDILAGAKLTSRTDGLNLGILNVLMKEEDDLGQKNHFVARPSLNVLEQSTVGAIFTYGDPVTSGDNWVAGADFNYRTTSYGDGKTVEGNAWYLQSDSTGASGNRNAFGFKLGYPNDRVSWRGGFTQIDDEFDAALGFVPRKGIREYFANYRYRWRPNGKLIRRIDASADVFVVTDLDDNVETSSVNLEPIFIETQNDDRVFAEYILNREVLDEPFEIQDDITIPVDDYRFDRYRVGVRTSTGRPISLGASYTGGDFYSGTRDDYVLDVAWRQSRFLFIGADFIVNDVDLPEGDFITRIIRGRVNIYFSPDVSWTNFIQYDNVSESVGLNSRFQWIIEPGNILYVVLNQNADRDDDEFLTLTDTALTTKLVWTLRF